MTTLTQRMADGKTLLWLPELNIGHVPTVLGDGSEDLYDDRYWANYEQRAATDMGRALTQARCDLVERHLDSKLDLICDVGIGVGQFIEAMRERDFIANGFDVNPRGVEWLRDRAAFSDPAVDDVQVLTYWDVLEHIPEPEEYLLRPAVRWVFISIPIFASANSVVGSRHFKPGEHLWYFTDRGLVGFMERLGYAIRDRNSMESDLGREDILSYAFQRV